MASSNNFIYSPNKFDEAFKKICDLVDRFKKERPDQSPDQMEYEARVYYIDRFFEALGWDVRGEDPNSYYAREVQFEYRVKVAHHTKRADYLFSASTKDRVRRFLVEAKKPWENLEREDFYFQAVRYGYSSRTPVVILTNFKEFHVLDCRYTPTKTQILHRCRNKYSLDEYLDKEKFREIYNVFSKEGANQGSIKNLVENWKALRGKGLYTGEYKDVDEKFLEELDMHRLELAKAFKKTNPNFDGATLTEAVQRTLDRLVFLRFLEDKGIEQQEHVSDFALSNSAWSDFIKLCRDSLKHKYNGLIFNEHRLLDTKDFKGPDEEAFKKTCDDLSRENTPYAFDLIPIEILGSIYERFLGKVVTTSSQRAKVEEKPEVRKAGGVYYTPQYIVEYIVKNTVGEKIKDHSPDQIAKMRFADIACGSGSFLLGVYTLLLGYHTKYYNEHPEKIKKGECNKPRVEGISSLSLKRVKF